MTETAEPLRIGLIGASLGGNRGAAAMVSAVVRGLGSRLPPGTGFVLFSLYPAADREAGGPEGLRMVPAAPLATAVLLPCAAALHATLVKAGAPSVLPRLVPALGEMLRCDVILDLSGISFVSGRLPNTLFNSACVLAPILSGVPCIKLSQAFGPLGRGFTRAAARLLLPGLEAVFPRGEVSAAHLDAAGIGHEPVAPDLAFTLPGGAAPRPASTRIALIPSEVMRRRCARLGIDYVSELAGFCRMASGAGAGIVVIAHSSLGPGRRSHNNDHHVCIDLMEAAGGLPGLEAEISGLGPAELRNLIAGCTVAVSSRFHGMVSALATGTPVAATAWSHKYAEVMRQFGMEDFVLEARDLSARRLFDLATDLIRDRDGISRRLTAAAPGVARAAEAQLDFVAGRLLNPVPERADRPSIPSRFLPPGCRPELAAGFSLSGAPGVARASGGLVTAVLARRLGGGSSTGAVVARCLVESGRVLPRTFLVSDREGVLASAGSIYRWFPHLAGILRILRETPGDGPIDVVALPCQASALRRAAASDPAVARRLGLVLCLWCGHATRGILTDELVRRWSSAAGGLPAHFRFRSGAWRGASILTLEDGREIRKPFGSGFGFRQNLHLGCRHACLGCNDHLGRSADLSFGDAWTRAARHQGRKRTMVLALTDPGRRELELLGRSGQAVVKSVPASMLLSAQGRSLGWHDRAPTRAALAGLFGLKIPGPRRVSLPHLPAAVIELALVRLSDSPAWRFLISAPHWVLMPVMLALKAAQQIARTRR